MTYEYKCIVCNNEFEAEQSINDKVGLDCPKCLTFCNNRLISSGVTFKLKGDCWASDGYTKKDSQ